MTALEGMRVLDLTQYEAGTSGTQWLGWFGADVVKVERPGTGDPGRTLAGGDTDSGYFVYWNGNKRSVAIDLEREEGRELLLQMVPHYDVFAENYGPGVMERLRLDYDAVKAVHPGIIYARIKGFGTDGPHAGYKCYDMVAQAAAGAFSITGEPDGPPMRPGPTIADSGSGLQLAFAITAAYVQKLREGVGQYVEISMQEAMTYFLRTTVGSSSDWGRSAAPRSGNGFGATTNLYACAPGGPNDYVYVIAVTPRQHQALCEAVGRPELVPKLLAYPFGADDDTAADAEAKQAIARWVRERTKYEAMECLADAGVPCSAVLDTKDLFEDPHLAARGFVKRIKHEELGELPVLGAPPRLSESPVDYRAAPLLGKHTLEVLQSDLGLDASELAALSDRGVIGAR